jgi:hypothetical protein
MDATVAFTLNGKPQTIFTDPRQPLLEVLREDLHVTGTKFGCGAGVCRACTAALREEVQFEDGKILSDSFGKYLVPRFDDVPEIEIHLIDRPDLPSAGAGETPIIAIAPAIASAVYRATGKSVRSLPVRFA